MMTPRKPPVADIDEDPNVEIGPYASPPCYAHEVDPAYFGLPAAPDPDRLPALTGMLRETEAAAIMLSTLVEGLRRRR